MRPNTVVLAFKDSSGGKGRRKGGEGGWGKEEEEEEEEERRRGKEGEGERQQQQQQQQQQQEGGGEGRGGREKGCVAPALPLPTSLPPDEYTALMTDALNCGKNLIILRR